MPIALSSGVMKIFRSAELTIFSPKAISPASGLSSPATHLSSVVLPDPLRPRSTKNSFSFTCRSTPSTAWTESVPVLNVFRSEWIPIIANYLNGLNVLNDLNWQRAIACEQKCMARLRRRRSDMLLPPRIDPKGRHQRRHDSHHNHGDRRRIPQPTAMPLSPNIGGQNLALRRSTGSKMPP